MTCRDGVKILKSIKDAEGYAQKFGLRLELI